MDQQEHHNFPMKNRQFELSKRKEDKNFEIKIYVPVLVDQIHPIHPMHSNHPMHSHDKTPPGIM
jgi:hypothetical protein